MTTVPRIARVRNALGLAGLAAILCGCPGTSEPTPPTDTSSLRATACGVYAVECVPLAGSSPNSLAVGDLDGDQAPDIVVANMGADNISVLLNDGGGKFTLSANYAVGDSPFVVRIADFDGDGYADFTSTGGSSVYILLNNGDGTFRRGGTITLSDPPFGLTVADLDGNGSPDIATANGLYRSIAILLNDGNGKFTKAPAVFVPGDFTQLGFITSADVDNDSNMDLIVVHTYGGRVSVFRNTGGASFAPPQEVDLGEDHVLNWPTPVDLDADGYVDLVVADSGNLLDMADLGNITLLRNDGTGVFTFMARLAADDTPLEVAAADVNGDGLTDLASANALSNDVTVHLGVGGGAFAAPESVAVGERPSFVATADMNGDGRPDLAVTNQKSDTVSILLNDGAGRFLPQP